MLVPAGSSIFFLREHRFAFCCPMSRRNFEAVVMDTVSTLFIHVECLFIAHILIYILHKYWMRNSILPLCDVCSV